MEPRIQYAQTKDGVSIAFSTLGVGMPFVYMPPLLFSHVQLEWQNPEWRRWQERLARKRKVVRYDGRGSGLSERNVSRFSLDVLMLDLEAVAQRLGLESFTLYGPIYSGPVAIAYAARHPEQVSHLILFGSSARGSDFFRPPQTQALQALRDKEWELYTETMAHVALGWSAGEPARRAAAYMRECVAPEAWQALFDALGGFDVAALLSEVKSPTLVLHRRQVAWPSEDAARGLASRIPDARLTLLEGESIAPWVGDREAAARAIDEFLGDPVYERAAAMPASGLVTILFTDMQSSTALTQKLGDAAAQEVRRAHNEIVRTPLNANGGSEIKHTGDGIMASFATASSALDCAIAIQRGVVAHKDEHPDSPLAVYIGLNAGEPIAEDDDLFGTSINLAARICDHAEAGQIVAADVVRQLAAGKDFLFSDLGETELRGFEDPVKLWELRWREQG